MKLTQEKTILHPKNAHRFGYDFEQLNDKCPELKQFVLNPEK